MRKKQYDRLLLKDDRGGKFGRQINFRLKQDIAAELETHATVLRLRGSKLGSMNGILEEAILLWLKNNPLPKHLVKAAQTLIGDKGGVR